MPRKKRGGKEESVPLWKRISLGRIVSVLFSIFMIMLLISFISMIFLIFVGPIPVGNIAVIPIKGEIVTDDGYSGKVSSENVVSWISEAEKNDEVKAILLDINSGGGSPVASDEIAQAVKKAQKPVVAVIRDIGASGAYWVASSADVIFANRMSITGSIGVIGSYLEFDGMMSDYNITYRRLVSGKYKDMGSPLKEMTQEEQVLMQLALDEIHRFFIDAVAENRNMSHEDVENLATGRIMIGVEAYDLGLVDELGTRQDAINYIEKELNITADIAEYRAAPSFLGIFSSFGKSSLGLDEEISVKA